MTVYDIVQTLERINDLRDRYINEQLKSGDFDTLIELISDYRDELLRKQVK
jgi:hypothetical protein